MVSWDKFVEWAFYAVIGGCAASVVAYLRSINSSILTLNEKMATMLERSGWMEKKLEEHGRRLERLESKGQRT